MTTNQIIFAICVLAAFGFFGYTMLRILSLFRFTRPAARLDKIGERITITLLVAFGQSKMVRKPVAGILHALVWWGFLVITLGTLEMIIDGLAGTERILGSLGMFYSLITASGEWFAVIIILSCFIFLYRRYLGNVKRFKAPEMKPSSRMDATVILFMIFLLMASLLGMNMGYLRSAEVIHGSFPVSHMINSMFFPSSDAHGFMMMNWWIHIVLVLVFLNILPYSKHFHVIMAVPNVFLSRLEPKAKLNSMEAVTTEVKLMMADMGLMPQPENVPAPDPNAAPARFGVKDVEDTTWKNILDGYTCTECGRCTDVCPANNTGKKLSPRKLFIDLRARMKTKSIGFVKEGKDYSDGLSLVGGSISEEELWACTTCMACIEECPVNIDHVPFIIDMRRNLVMEESKASPELNLMFSNIENNGAPWQFNPEDRLKWAEELNMNRG